LLRNRRVAPRELYDFVESESLVDELIDDAQ
jgi:hypothetical protein